jgi:LuxR family maltose regulon positive regulatory protein
MKKKDQDKVEQLLSTKFYIPATRKDLVSRQRLIRPMKDGLRRKLTLISAPAGFGKTTVVCEWIEDFLSNSSDEDQENNIIAWLSLDEKDNDPVRFHRCY